MTVYKNKNLNIAPKANTRRGFTLAEIITVMVISAMIMISTLTVFTHIRKTTASINAKLDKEDIADEILQRIAEDLDRLATPGFDTTVTIKYKASKIFNKTQLVIQNKIYDKNNKPQIFEKIVWQSEYDELEGMTILYRHHGGLCLEDKILDGQLKDIQADGTERFVPICWGMTLFEIVVPKENAEPLTQWSSAKLPTSVVVNISFAEPVENFDGELEILEEDIITRHIAIDRTRKPRFVFKKKDFTRPDSDDPNEPDDSGDPNDIDATTKNRNKEDSGNKKDKLKNKDNKGGAKPKMADINNLKRPK